MDAELKHLTAPLLCHENIAATFQAFCRTHRADGDDETATAAGAGDVSGGEGAAASTTTTSGRGGGSPEAGAGQELALVAAKRKKAGGVRWAPVLETVLVMAFCDKGTLQVREGLEWRGCVRVSNSVDG